MRHVKLKRRDFAVLAESKAVQAAVMVLGAGEATSDRPENEHAKAEQWVYVVSGAGRAIVGERRVTLGAGSLLLIDRGEPHQIRCAGEEELVTVNFYAPPAYTKDGEVRESAKR